MSLIIKYYRLNLEYDAQCTALHASKYEALNAAYYKINGSQSAVLDKAHSNEAYLSLETIYNDKYASLEEAYKKQCEDLNTKLIATRKDNDELSEENGKLVNEYNEVLAEYNKVADINNIKAAAYKCLLEKYMSLTGLYDKAVARNKQFDAYLEAHVSTPAGVEKL
jgi:predicted nuclease with TOPRIM domain